MCLNLYKVSEYLIRAIGLTEAVLLTEIESLLKHSYDAREEENGIWIYRSIKDWEKPFHFLSAYQIKKTLTSLENAGFLISKQVDVEQRDNTKGYTINFDKYYSACSKSTDKLIKSNNYKYEIKSRSLEYRTLEEKAPGSQEIEKRELEVQLEDAFIKVVSSWSQEQQEEAEIAFEKAIYTEEVYEHCRERFKTRRWEDPLVRTAFILFMQSRYLKSSLDCLKDIENLNQKETIGHTNKNTKQKKVDAIAITQKGYNLLK